MKILFDSQIFSLQKYGGISRYFTSIIQEIERRPNIENKLGILYSDNYYIKKEKQPLDNFLFRGLLSKVSRRNKWNKSYCKYLLKKNNFDVFHPTYFNPYFLKYLKKPLVITIHDMTYEALPEYFPNSDPLTWQKRILAERADKIIAISETTKADIIKYLQVDSDKIEVIYHGIDNADPSYEEVKDLPYEYLLYVGERGGYKNFFMLAEAFTIVSKKYPKLKLVLAGGGALTYGDKEYLIRNNIIDKVVQFSVNDAQLNTLYKNAKCFIFPSLYEGFGLPILEAFINSTPILLSNCSCFEEIAGNEAARYFNHNSIDSLVAEIEYILTNQEGRNKLILAGRERLKQYTMQECLSKTIELYETLA